MKTFLSYDEYLKNPDKVFEKEMSEPRFDKDEKTKILNAVIAFEEETSQNLDNKNIIDKVERLIDKDLLILSYELKGLKGIALSRAILLILADSLKLKHYSILYRALTSKIVASSLNLMLTMGQYKNREEYKEQLKNNSI